MTPFLLVLASAMPGSGLPIWSRSPPAVSILDYGAKPGGEVDCTQAITRAVAAATAAVAAAGPAGVAHVVIPRGLTFLTGSFSLATGVYLWLDPGSVLLASTELSGYPAVGACSTY